MITIKRILFPTDLSDFSKGALPFARHLARQTNAHLEVLHVMPPLLYEEELEERKHPETFYAGARDALVQFVPIEPGLEIDRIVRAGKAAPVIADVAKDSGADLIVMSTHGKSALMHLLFGSVAEQVLREATCPVLCIRTPAKVPMPVAPGGRLRVRRILCPVDFSDACNHAIGMAFELAKDEHASVVLLHVASLPDVAYMGYGAPGAPLEMNDYLEDMREALQKIESPDQRIAVERRLEDGNPPAVIVDVAHQISADLIVMGTNGHKGLAHALLGSVAEQVVRTAPCPVLTLRANGT